MSTKPSAITGLPPASPCTKCGIEGLHSCPGTPIVWTEEERLKFAGVMQELFPSRALHAPLPTNA